MTTLDTTTRTTLRRALRKAGFTSDKIRSMSDTDLQHEASKLENAPALPATTEHAKPAPVDTKPAPASDDAVQALQAALAALIPQQPTQPIDTAALAQLVKDEIAKQTPTVHIQHFEPAKSKKIEGAHKMLPAVLRALKLAPLTNVWPYLCGPTGSGKTTLARHAADALSIPFHYTNAVNDKFELTGFVDANGKYQETSFYRAFKHGGLFLFDEKDGSAPEAVLAFNMALANGAFTFPNGEEVTKHDTCYFMAGGNTFGLGATSQYSARERMDAAVRNRYVCITIDYDLVLERNLAEQTALSVNDKIESRLLGDWHERVVTARRYANEQKLDAIFSPRQTVAGAALLADGVSLSDVSDMIFSPELSDAQYKTLRAQF